MTSSDPQLSQSVHSSSDSSTVCRKGSTLSDGLLIGLARQQRFASDPDLTSLSATDVSDDAFSQYDGPEHVVKVFRLDQSFRYLLIHKVCKLQLCDFYVTFESTAVDYWFTFASSHVNCCLS